MLRPGLNIQHLGGTCSSCWMIFSHRVHDIKTRRTVCDPRPTYFSGSPYPRGGRVDFLLKKVKRVFNVLKKTFWVRKSLIWRSANLERLGRITLNVTLCGRVCTIEVEWAQLNCSRRLEWNEGSAREPALRFEIHATNINKICTSRELGPHELVAVAFPRCYSWSLSSNAITSPFSRKNSNLFSPPVIYHERMHNSGLQLENLWNRTHRNGESKGHHCSRNSLLLDEGIKFKFIGSVSSPVIRIYWSKPSKSRYI